MAKKQTEEMQLELYPEEPKIIGLGVAEFKLKSGEVHAVLHGTTNKGDAAQITDSVWQNAIAEWLVELCGNESTTIDTAINCARHAAHLRDQEIEATRAAMDLAQNIRNFPAGAGGALA